MGNYRNRRRLSNNGPHSMTRLGDVRFDKDIVYFYKLNHPAIVSETIRGIKKAIKEGIREFYLDFSHISQVFPNVAAPLCAILSYYVSQGVKINYLEVPEFLQNMNICEPKMYASDTTILNKVWKFNAECVGTMVDAYIEELSLQAQYPKGFLTATEWTLNEVMDNVIQHSNVECGFVMGQVHPATKHLAFTVFDLGQGIYNSFKHSTCNPRNAVDAITIALQESVTRDKSIGQGNGLFGLSSLIKRGADSRLKITSGTGHYSYKYGESFSYYNCPIISKDVNMTTVDFMLDYSNEVSFEDALVFNGSVYTPITLRIENLEDINGNILIKVKEESNGTGTRDAAKRIKNKIYNILTEEPKNIILDFAGVSVISSSYADELIAKLFCDLGLFQFNRIIKICGLSDEQQLILQKSVIQRIIEDFNTRQ